MNCEQAKALSIVDFLSRFGYVPHETSKQDVWYLSPWRNEREASFHVHTGKNIWYDCGDGIGGTIVDLSVEFLKKQGKPCEVSDALTYIENTGLAKPLIKAPVQEYIENDPTLSLTSVRDIEHPALKKYLASRGIPLWVADRDMKEVKLYNKNSKKHFFALGMKNEEDGFELRNTYFKGCLGAKDITVIKGWEYPQRAFHLFEGSFDYETLLTMNDDKRLKHDVYILHSVINLKKIIPYITQYPYEVAFSWLDNDLSGRKAQSALMDILKTESGLLHKPMNKIYRTHKDLNAWHMHKLGLSA